MIGFCADCDRSSGDLWYEFGGEELVVASESVGRAIPVRRMVSDGTVRNEGFR